MASRSSTSSFNQWPVAGLLALVMVLAADHFLFGVHGPWLALRERVEGGLPRGLVADRLELRKLLDAPEAHHRAVVVGSSRAQAGFAPYFIPDEYRSSLTFGKLAHAGIEVFTIRSLVEEALKYDIDAVVMILSEFDMNRPVRSYAHVGFSSLPAIRDLIAEVGVGTCFDHRVNLYRLVAASVLDSYRLRRALHSAFADDLRRFELDDRFPRRRSTLRSPPLVEGGERRDLSDPERARIQTSIQQAFPHLNKRAAKLIFDQIHAITRGPHSEVQAGLVRRAIRRLSEAGVKVVIAEAPLHPLAEEIYDASIRQEFLDFASSLEKELDVGFIPIEASGPYGPEEFRDPTHLDRPRAVPDSGSAKLTRVIAATVDELLP